MSFHTVNNRFTLCLHYILLRAIKSKFRFNYPSTKTSTTIAVCAVKKHESTHKSSSPTRKKTLKRCKYDSVQSVHCMMYEIIVFENFRFRPSTQKRKFSKYRIYSINRPGRLLNFWTLIVGAYSRWARGGRFSASVVCLFCNKTINAITKREEVTKQGFCKIRRRKLRPRGSLLLLLIQFQF